MPTDKNINSAPGDISTWFKEEKKEENLWASLPTKPTEDAGEGLVWVPFLNPPRWEKRGTGAIVHDEAQDVGLLPGFGI